MPDGAIYVGRPTVWGNPFGGCGLPVPATVVLYGNAARGIWRPDALLALAVSDATGQQVYAAMLAWTKRMGDHPLHMIRAHLTGRDLVCWCREGDPCHGDVLLELANREA